MTVSSPKRKKLSETVHIDLLSDSDVSDSDSDGKFPAVVRTETVIRVGHLSTTRNYRSSHAHVQCPRNVDINMPCAGKERSTKKHAHCKEQVRSLTRRP